jgi:hypothetical protein
MVLREEVELDYVPDLCDYVFRLEVKAVVGGRGACEDAVDNAGAASLTSRGSEDEQEESGSLKANKEVFDHCDGDVCCWALFPPNVSHLAEFIRTIIGQCVTLARYICRSSCNLNSLLLYSTSRFY